jgi:hypothetical protein
MFTLDEDIIKQYYTLATRHVHAVTGLTFDADAPSPCTSGTSRWVARKRSACGKTRIDSDSRDVIERAVKLGSRGSISGKKNNLVRDVTIHAQCTADAGAKVVVDGTCWENVHR